MDTIKCNDEPLRELALFAGAGGGILGGQLLGWQTVCAVEYEPHARAVLCARQNDGCLEPFPIWDDVRTFDGTAWRGRVDIVSGGFPCQDISCAGKGAGITGERSGLWGEMARIVGEVRPRFVWVENSPMLVSRGLGLVLLDLAKMGYDARWGVVGASDAGAPHKRERVWIVANAALSNDQASRSQERDRIWSQGKFGRGGGCKNNISNPNLSQRQGMRCAIGSQPERANLDTYRSFWRQDPAEQAESGMGRMAHGLEYQLDRLERIGNGQCPQAMALAWQILSR